MIRFTELCFFSSLELDTQYIISFMEARPANNSLPAKAKIEATDVVGLGTKLAEMIATPSGEYPQNKAILFLPDVFGPQLPNAQARPSISLARTCCLTQIFHRFSSSPTTLLSTASKLAAIGYYMPNASDFHPI
jgi:hypothetical protein